MDIAPAHQQPATNDDELAKVLAGISGAAPTPSSATPSPTEGLEFEETPPSAANVGIPAPSEKSATTLPQPTSPDPVSEPQITPPSPTMAPATSSDLDGLKRTALDELRPLINKLNLPPEEKFDTLLLIIRSTDDQSLLQPAHDTAKLIADDSRRAQALLDIIKEIDYFAANTGQQEQ